MITTSSPEAQFNAAFEREDAEERHQLRIDNEAAKSEQEKSND